jgi:hypothetical protein
MRSDIAREYGASHQPTWRGYYFSDAILMTAERSARGFIELIDELRRLSGQLLYSHGLLLRGAISGGPVYESSLERSLGAIVFGPAVVKAVRLEECAAVFPRIIVDPALDDECNEHLDGVGRYPLIGKDADAMSYIDYVGATPWWSVGSRELGEVEKRRLWLAKVSECAQEGLKCHSRDPSISRKYEWLSQRHAEVLNRHPDLRAASGSTGAR